MTVLKLDHVQVVAVRGIEDGYAAVQLGAGSAKAKNTSKPMRGHFAKANVLPKSKLAEFRVSEDAVLEVGDTRAKPFVVGQKVDCVGTTQGKGFAGAMKRLILAVCGHRTVCQSPPLAWLDRPVSGSRKVFKGKKMAGQMGAVRNTTQNLEVVAVDDAGDCSHPWGRFLTKNGWVLISDAVKAAMPEAAPFPAGLMGDASEEDAGADEAVAEAAVAEAAPVEEAAPAGDKAPADDADQADADKE